MYSNKAIYIILAAGTAVQAMLLQNVNQYLLTNQNLAFSSTMEHHSITIYSTAATSPM